MSAHLGFEDPPADRIAGTTRWGRRREMKDELLPCPFCGGVATLFRSCDTFGGWYVECCDNGGCHSTTKNCKTAQDAIDARNTRAKQTCRWKRYEPADAWETECGEMLTWAPEGYPPYCPNCGRKVIDDD